MIRVELSAGEVSKFRQWTRTLDERTKQQVRIVVVDAITSLERGAKSLAPVSKDKKIKVGNRLRSSIRTVFSQDALGGEVWVNANYAPYMEFGTGRFVRVLPGYESYAMQFKGAGIRDVNVRPQPFFFDVW